MANIPRARRLAISEQRYRDLLEQAADGIFLLDENGNFLMANSEICEMLGYASDELLRLNILDTYPKELRDVGRARLDEIRSGERMRFERPMKRKDGSVFPVEMSARRLADGEMQGIAHDITERKRTEFELALERSLLNALMENIPDYIYFKDSESRFIRTSRAHARMFGLRDATEAIGKTDMDFFSEEHARKAYEDEQRIVRTGEPILNVEEKETWPNRPDTWALTTKMPLRDHEGNTTGTFGISRDITERKRTEFELALERSLLNALMENIPGYIYFKDTESRFIRTSRAHARMFGLGDATEAIGKTDMDFFSEEHARKAYEDEQRIVRTGEPILNVEEKETWPNRVDTWVSTTKMPLRDHEGNITGTFGISRDITEQKRAEERILSLARFPDESPDPVMRVTPDGSVIYANKASEPLTSSWAGGVDKKVPSEYLRALTHVRESGEKQEIEIREATATYAITIVPFTDAGYINLYGRDVTEEKSLAERLNQAQKMEAIGQLAGGIAHDFNNILQVITGYCELLKKSLPEESQKYVLEITLAARRAATLTAQLLAFSRKQILRPRVVNTKELFHSMQRMLERVIGEEIELRTFINPDTGNLLADAGQMEQVLLNLAVNARDAMPSGGRLTTETSNRTFDEAYVRDHLGAKAGQYVCIAVSDTGVGMDQETLSHIYEPFFTTKEQGKGTGLGLATVYGIVKQSGGYINCYSELGKGTTFTIYLPLTLEEADKPLVTTSGTTASRGRETVLLVEDDGAVRGFARSVLEDEGYLVIEASGGEEALSDVFARSLTVALLVTDVVMPRMSGKELARKLEDICPRVKVLYVSGYTSNAISRHGILDAGLDFLQKPFSSLEFLAKVREILDRP